MYSLQVVVIAWGIGKTWAKNKNFDKANILKIIILPSRGRFFLHHILKTFSIPIFGFLEILFKFNIFIVRKKISTLLHLLSKQYIWFHRLPFSPLSVVLSGQFLFLISLVLNMKAIKIKKLYSAILLLNLNCLRKRSCHLHKLFIGRYFREILDF